ncbi:MAG TPA: zinc ABC transporter substrate-binding protein [Acidimicrobiales bacterium]|nr:zinc ABC transporter substrate-binding protein [Acidimicrobiales bacterium]
MATVALVAVLAGGCASRQAFPDDGKRNVVAAFYPLAEAARRVGGDAVRVVDLTPPNVEPHDLEPTSKQVDRIEAADVVVEMGNSFQPAVSRAAERAEGRAVRIEFPANDPHIWLDPVRMQGIVDQVAAALKDVPGSVERAAAFKQELAALDVQFRAGLAECERTTLVTAHEAFGWLAKRYGLTQEAIAGFSPDAEPDPRKLAELADLVKRTGTTTVFTESLVSPKVAEALARETGARTDVLDPMESGAPGAYVAVMQANLQRIRAALSCR